MAIGMFFIIAGILIAAFPKLLSIVVATFLIMVGAILAAMSYHFKKVNRKMDNTSADNPFVDFFMRF